MRLGLDIDGTITADPAFFADLTKAALTRGDVHIVSSRSPEARNETIVELAKLGINFGSLHLLPPMSTSQALCPHRNLDWYQRHQWLKVDYALKNNLSHFVDDDRKVLALFTRFAPSIVAVDFQNRQSLVHA